MTQIWYGGRELARNGALSLPADPMHVQLRKKAIWNEARSLEGADFFTVSYAGRTIEEFADAMLSVGVATLVDIRYNPVSMYKPDFSKSNLRRHLESVGVAYLHFPDLGIPRDIRSLAIDKPDRSDLWEWYDRYVVGPYVGLNLHHFLNFADHPVALMCVEADPTSCHRHRLGLALERMGLQGFDLQLFQASKEMAMLPRWTTARVLITARTYPTPARTGIEVSCTGGITAEGQWIRLFPVPYRFLDDDKRFHKYQWIDVRVSKASDYRPESYRIDQDSIQIVSPRLSTVDCWRARKEFVYPLQEPSLA